MAVTINLRHLETHNVELVGEIAVAELDLGVHDETVQARDPLGYELEGERVEESLLVRGRLSLPLHCECVRCLKPVKLELTLDPWTCFVPLEGEEAAPIINDCVDLTPYIREDILLEFPQHPLCNPECSGLQEKPTGKKKKAGSAGKNEGASSAWSELNKLKF